LTTGTAFSGVKQVVTIQANPPMDLKPGAKLGHFEILSLLGEGGQSLAFLLSCVYADWYIRVRFDWDKEKNRISRAQTRHRFRFASLAFSFCSHNSGS
jgi:hypothetical protein